MPARKTHLFHFIPKPLWEQYLLLYNLSGIPAREGIVTANRFAAVYA
jgi:hypothetical protein